MGAYTIEKENQNGGNTPVNIEVRVHLIAEPKGSTKGFASMNIDGMFGVHGISIIKGKNGLFVSMPQAKDAKGEWRDIFHPVTSDGRKTLNNAVLTEYAATLDGLAAQKESALEKIRDAQKPDKSLDSQKETRENAVEKECGKSGKKKAGSEL
jgi:stage V sporulation protein G